MGKHPTIPAPSALDGLGAVGGGAHARPEHVSIEGMIERAAVAAGVLAAFAR